MKIYEVETITSHLEVEIEDDWDCICGYTSTITFRFPKNLWDSFKCNFCDEKLVIVEPILLGETYSELLTENNLQLDESGYELEPIDAFVDIKLTENNKEVGELIHIGSHEMDGATLCDWCNMYFKGDGKLERCNSCYKKTR